jgi:hypothetical protein
MDAILSLAEEFDMLTSTRELSQFIARHSLQRRASRVRSAASALGVFAGMVHGQLVELTHWQVSAAGSSNGMERHGVRLALEGWAIGERILVVAERVPSCSENTQPLVV